MFGMAILNYCLVELCQLMAISCFILFKGKTTKREWRHAMLISTYDYRDIAMKTKLLKSRDTKLSIDTICDS